MLWLCLLEIFILDEELMSIPKALRWFVQSAEKDNLQSQVATSLYLLSEELSKEIYRQNIG